MSSSRSSCSTLTSPIVGGLRTRHQVKVSTPDPTTASQVVAHYLIPMFEAETQLKSNISRSATFGTAKPALEPLTGTVYGELKLSETLGKELTQLKLELADTNSRLKEAQQRTSSAMSDLNLAQNRIISLEADLKASQFSASLTSQQLQTIELSHSGLSDSLKSLQTSYSLLESQLKSGNLLIQEQLATIDKLRNKATEKEHINSLLSMENDLIGEKLKGLYFAIQKVADFHVFSEITQAEIAKIANSCKELSEFTVKINLELREIMNQRDNLIGDNAEMVSFRENLKAEKDRLAKIAKEKVSDLLMNMQKSEDEREKLTAKLEESEKNFKDLTEEYEKMRQKAKQYRIRRKQYGEEEEKVCKNCQRVFIESENFNWSCRRHQTEYSGEVYWCCGKSSRDALGCKISKHESKEDEEEDDIGKEGADQVTQKCPVRFT